MKQAEAIVMSASAESGAIYYWVPLELCVLRICLHLSLKIFHHADGCVTRYVDENVLCCPAGCN